MSDMMQTVNNPKKGIKYEDDSSVESLKVIETKVFEIGDWDMNASAQNPSLAHNLDITKIKKLSALIRNDDDSSRVNFPVPDTTGSGAEYIFATVTNLILVRATNGFFDNTSYDDQGGVQENRGWIYVEYEV